MTDADWQLVWLSMMAVALVIMATIQIAAIVVAARFAKQAFEAIQDVRKEIKPLIEKANRVADDAARATALAVVQVERVDRLLANTVERVDETMGMIQHTLLEPLRQGSAWMSALRTGFSMFRSGLTRDRRPRTRDDEDPLFVG